jgi:hypothetical protein
VAAATRVVQRAVATSMKVHTSNEEVQRVGKLVLAQCTSCALAPHGTLGEPNCKRVILAGS